MTKHVPEWMLDLIERQDLEIKEHKQTIQEAYAEIAAMRDEFYALKVEEKVRIDVNYLQELVYEAANLMEVRGIECPDWFKRANAAIAKAEGRE